MTTGNGNGNGNGNGTAPQIVKVPSTELAARGVGHELATAAVAAQARALVEARYVMAVQRPRDIDLVRVKLLNACKRPTFANAARYLKPVGKGIEGPSIRLAEEAARCMGNIAVDIFAIYDDERRRVIRVTATDLESNVPYSKDVTFEKTVERNSVQDGQAVIAQRIGSRGQRVFVVLATDDDILNKENALVSKALRTNLLRLVPGDILEEAMAQVYATLKDRAAKDPGAERKEVIDAFAHLNVMPDMLKEYLGHDIGTASPAEIVDLRSVYATIRDGEANWNEVMDHRRKERSAADTPPAAPPADAAKAPAAAPAAQAPQPSSAAAAPPPQPTAARAAAKKGQANLGDVAAASRARRENAQAGEPGPDPISAEDRGDDPLANDPNWQPGRDTKVD
jgi:hypothetical protein